MSLVKSCIFRANQWRCQPVKKNNKMFMSANKKTTLKLRDKTVDVKETKDIWPGPAETPTRKKPLKPRIHCNTNPVMPGQVETPRALFASYGKLVSRI